MGKSGPSPDARAAVLGNSEFRIDNAVGGTRIEKRPSPVDSVGVGDRAESGESLKTRATWDSPARSALGEEHRVERIGTNCARSILAPFEDGFMRSLTKFVCFSVTGVALALGAAGCGGQDNEKTMLTNADGTVDKSEGSASGPMTSEEAYKQMMKSQANSYGTYGGAKKKAADQRAEKAADKAEK